MAGYDFRTTASAAALAATCARQARGAGVTSIIPIGNRSALRSPLCGTVSATALAAALLWPGSAVYAAQNCSPTADGAGNPNGTIITCTGATTPPGSSGGGGANVGYGDTVAGPQNNTINVVTGASVTGAASALLGQGFALGTGNILNNNGTVSAGAIAVDAVGTLTVNNNGTGVITSTSATGSGVIANNLTVTNNGTVNTGGIALNGQTSLTLTNNSTISTTVANTAVSAGVNGNITNNLNGTISNAAAGSFAVAAGTGVLTVNNSGVIQQTGGGANIAIFGATLATGTNITNNGTIQATGASSTQQVGIETAGSTTVITNNAGATIQATASGPTAQSIGVLSFSTVSTMATNNGTISGGQDGFNTNSSGTTTLVNSGTISGTVRAGVRVNTANITNNATGLITGAVGIMSRPGSGGMSVFNAGTITGTAGAIPVAIQFSSGATANTLTLAPGFIINGNVLGAGTDTFQLGGTGTGTLNASLIGATQQYQGFTTFNKISTSTWTLTGTGASNQNWNISGGTLIGDTNSIKSTTVTISNNAALNFTQAFTGTFAGTITGTGSLTKDGGGTVTLTTANNYQGSTTVLAGTLALSGAGTLGMAGNSVTVNGATAVLDLGGSTQTQNAGVSLQGGGTIQNGTLVTNTTFDMQSGTVSASLLGAGTLVKSTAGTVTLSGANNYLGGTTITGGTLALSGAGTLGNTANTVTVNGATATLNLGGTTQTQNGGVSLQGGGTIANGTLSSSGTFDMQSGSVSASLVGSGSLVKSTAGTVILSGANSYAGPTTITAGTLQVGNGGTTGTLGASVGTVTDNGTLAFDRSDTVTVGNAVSGTGGLSQIGTGTLVLTGANNYGGITTIAAGTLQVGNGGTTGTLGTGNVVDNATLAIAHSDTVTLANNISGSGGLTQMGTGTTILTGANNYTGTTTISAGVLQIGTGGTLGTGNVVDNATLAINSGGNVTIAGNISGTGVLNQTGTGTTILTGANTYSGLTTISAGTLQVGNGGTSGTLGTGNVVDSATLAFNRSDTVTVANAISGTGALNQSGAGTTVLTGANSYSGVTTVSAGTLQVGNGGTSGTLGTNIGTITDNGTLAFDRSDTVTLGNAISGTGGLSQIGNGTLILTGASTYTGATNVNSGVLAVTGALASSVNVASGAVLTGTGTVGGVTVMGGGTLAPGTAGAPGTSLHITGNLAFQSAALYLISVNPTTASSTSATGNASLAGFVAAVFAPGTYTAHQYLILHSAGLGGSKFDGVIANAPAGFTASLLYNGGDVLLDLELAHIQTTGLNGNQQNVANALNAFAVSGGTLPPAFVNIFALSPSQQAGALSQLSGEIGTSAAQAGFQTTAQFLQLIIDQLAGESPDGPTGSGGTAMGYARERAPARAASSAFAMLTKAPRPAPGPWSVWGGAFGGQGKIAGDTLVGSTDLSVSNWGFAAGADYRVQPGTVLGLSLAGGESNFALAQGLGSGRSDTIQLGAYGLTRQGAAYLSAAGAFAWHQVSTDRTITVPGLTDHLTASYNATGAGGRIEGGYWVAAVPGAPRLAPYAALQAQVFHTPSYSETDASGLAGFGLSFDATNTTDSHSELGLRFDQALPGGPDAKVNLIGRAAWEHEFSTSRAIAAVFQNLPGAGFTVAGAVPARDAAITSGGAEIKFRNGVSLIGKFDGEFAGRDHVYAGSGAVRFSW